MGFSDEAVAREIEKYLAHICTEFSPENKASRPVLR